MNLMNIIEIREVDTVKEANKLLTLGWRLLEIFKTANGAMYLLGCFI